MNRKLGFAVVTVLYLLSAATSSAQKPVDVSQCFSPILQQVRTFASLTRLDLAYLAQMDLDKWSTASKDGAVAVAGIAAGSFSQFSAERERLFQEESLNISYFQTINTSSVTLDSEAYDVIKECLKTQAIHQGGLTYVITSHNQSDVSIRFYWNSNSAPYELGVRGVATNATTLDPDARKGQLFSPDAKVKPDGPILELTRTNPDEAIRIVLKTTPPVGYEPIYIAPYEQSPKFKDTWVLSTFVDNPDPEKYKIGEENFNAIYDRSTQLSGPIVFVDCAFNAPYYHMELCQPVSGSVLHCRANKQRSDNHALWATTARYLQPIKKCIDHCGEEPQRIVDEDNPANYSFNAVQAIDRNLTGCTWAARKVQ